MYGVPNRFHTIVASGAETRIRIYLFGPGVDPTDDNDVQTNGTLLKMLPADTDSNSRIDQSGIQWQEILNKSKNLQIGGTASRVVTFGLINTDGAYNGYNFQMCKMYLDAWDADNSTWIPCPMGVYVFETPEQTFSNTIKLRAFDMMQDLDAIADSWFNNLPWSSGISIQQLFVLLANQCGKVVTISSSTVNRTITFTQRPFVSDNYTYRDILGWLAEVTGSVARFDRDGSIVLSWYKAARIGNNTYTINANQSGSGVFKVVKGEYSVAAITGINVQCFEIDGTVPVGSAGSVYEICGNPFINDPDANNIVTIVNPILTKISGLGSYVPIQIDTLIDWSIEAGDIINIVYNGTTYALPIFQITQKWKGVSVRCTAFSSGNKTMPLAKSEEERRDYRAEKTMYGRVTFKDLETPGETVINGSNISGGTITLGGQNNVNGSLTIKDSNGNTTGTITKDGANFVDPAQGNATKIDAGTIYLVDENGVTRAMMYAGQDGAWIEMNESGGNSLTIDSSGNYTVTDGNDNELFSLLPGIFSGRIALKDATGTYYMDCSVNTSFSLNVPYILLNGQLTLNGNPLFALTAPGIDIPNGSDLNDFTDQGVWSCQTAAIASSLSNCPVTTAFKLIVSQLLSEERYYQILLANNSVDIRIRFVNKTTNTFGAWKQVNLS